jgi:hypothetical protein
MGSTRLPPTFDPREEPGALVAHAGICAGGGQKWPSLPRPSRKNLIPSITSSATDQPQLNCVLQELFQFLEEARQAGVLLQQNVIFAR